MQATGIPSILLTSMMVKKMRAEVSTKLDNLPSMVSAEILRKCAVNGAVPVTSEDLERMRSNIVAEMNTALQNSVSEMYRVSTSVAAGLRRSQGLFPGVSSFNSSTDALSSAVTDRFTLFAWNNSVAIDGDESQLQLHRAPKDFSFPRKNIKHLWILWFFGDLKNRISPYRLFTSSDLSKQERPQKTRTKQVMNCLERLGIVATLERDASSNSPSSSAAASAEASQLISSSASSFSHMHALTISSSLREALSLKDTDSDTILAEKMSKATVHFDLAVDYLVYLIPNNVGNELRKTESSLNTIYNDIQKYDINKLLEELERKHKLRA
jgi:hypothetical protein